jgi:hypothetical protein
MKLDPATWSVQDVEDWAHRVGLDNEAIQALLSNSVNGPTLITLSKSELMDEIGIRSLPARRYLWDLIEQLKSFHAAQAGATALKFHEKEIDAMEEASADADASGGTNELLIESLVAYLQFDTAQQRQIYVDHALAHQIQEMQSGGQNVYYDAEQSRLEQERYDLILEQSESDRQYALSLASPHQDQNELQQQNPHQGHASADSLFRRSVEVCVANQIDVATALQTRAAHLPTGQGSSSGSISSSGYQFTSIERVAQCSVCMEQSLKCFFLACGHPYCVDCLRTLFLSAQRDFSLLPPQCCGIPIDMNLSCRFLNSTEIASLNAKVTEKEAKNKMFCPNCSQFYNRDFIDSSESKNLHCKCGNLLCTICGTNAHPALSCQENQQAAASETAGLSTIVASKGWKQCPGCRGLIDHMSGCNHMTCKYCQFEFCYVCLKPWNKATKRCSSGKCELWDEEMLMERSRG